jgi:hypothetical protein
MDDYTEGWEAHKEHVHELIQTMVDDGTVYAGALEDLEFRLASL